MIPCPQDRTVNITYLEAPLERVWWSVATAPGSSSYLTYYARTTGAEDEPKIGDRYTLNYGDINNESVVIRCEPPHHIALADTYDSMDPDGRTVRYLVSTAYTLEQQGSFVKLTLKVTGFEPTTHGQWFRECLEMGWRRSLMNLKSVLELGLDLRIEMFSYPRLGVANCTVNEEQSPVVCVPVREGNYLLQVFPNSPVDRAGMQAGDVIVEIGGMPTPDYPAFVRAISSFYGKTAEPVVVYVRDGVRCETTVRLSLDETFTGLIDIEETPLEEVRKKRELLARQRSGSGSLWKTDEAVRSESVSDSK